MAYADWTFTQTSGTESVQLNSSLSSPLTIGGVYCRRMAVTGSTQSDYSYLRLADAYSSGAFINVPNTRAIRLEACMRLETATNNVSPAGLWLLAKQSGAPSNGTVNMSCYRLGIGGNGSSLKIRFGSPGVFTDIQDASLATWYRLRMSVYPLGAGGDRIICERETTLGSGSWSTILDTTISSSAGNFVPWGATRTNGFAMTNANLAGTRAGFVDLFNAYVATAP